MIRRTFPLEQNVYFRKIIFLYGTRAEINRWGKRAFNDDELMKDKASGNWSLFVRDGFQTDVISLVSGLGVVTEMGSLLHEVVHHAVYVFNRIQCPIEEAGGNRDEPFCYYVQHVFALCLRAIKESRRQ